MKRKKKSKHLESSCSPPAAKMLRGISDLPDYELFSATSSEDKNLVPKAKEPSYELEYYPYHTGLSNAPEAEIQKSQEVAPDSYARSYGIPAHSKAAGGTSSASQGGSFLNKPLVIEGAEAHNSQQEASSVQYLQMPLLQDPERQPMAHPCQHHCFHFHLADEPCTFAAHRRTERVMKVYYTRVERKRRAHVTWDTQEGPGALGKRMKVEAMTFAGKVPETPSLSYESTQDLVTDDSSFCVEEPEPELEQEGLSCQPVLPTAEEERPLARASSPEWLVTPMRGFKCLACCRIFPSLEDLQEHVQHGVSEGFSCRIFHLALSWQKSKRRMKDKRSKRKNRFRQSASTRKEEEH